jgi:hypothetical protein
MRNLVVALLIPEVAVRCPVDEDGGGFPVNLPLPLPMGITISGNNMEQN